MIAAIRVQNIHEALHIPGAYQLRYGDDFGTFWGMAFVCPCGCGEQSWLPNEEMNAHGWTFTGTLDRPTARPSVLQSGLPCKWHGYLTDGVWVEL